MPIRVSGVASGFDTENMVKQLTSKAVAQKDKVWKQQKTLEYKQDAWKDMNKIIYGFFADTLAKTRLNSTYKQNNIKSSDSNIATVTGKNFTGIQTIEVKDLASATYLTGGQVAQTEPIGISDKIIVKIAGEEKEINITSDMSIHLVAKKLEEVGLKANFDEKNGRLFLASKFTGAASNFHIESSESTLEALGLGSTAIKQEGKDALISYNGAEFKSDNNSFNINGLNISVANVGTTRISMNEDSKIYDIIKDFFDKYNNLIKKIDGAYNKSKNKGYDPLTEDEKYALSERQIDEWENKIKESILSKDTTLGAVSNILKNDMLYMSYDGLNLSSLGITTGSYFNTSSEDRGVYNIDENKLKEMIANDPDKVINFMTKLSNKLYDDLNVRMKSSNTNSVYTVYQDKRMKEDLNNYSKKIADWDLKIAKMEDKYYAQFAKMESALSLMQSKSQYLSNYLSF